MVGLKKGEKKENVCEQVTAKSNFQLVPTVGRYDGKPLLISLRLHLIIFTINIHYKITSITLKHYI